MPYVGTVGMERLHFEGNPGGPEASPDMSVLDAADAMERGHGTRLIVRERDRVIGVLTENDIIRKVLAEGRRPDAVSVREIMTAGLEVKDGNLLLEEPPRMEEEGEPGEPLQEVLRGKCEECGVFSLDLHDIGGLLMCPDCR